MMKLKFYLLLLVLFFFISCFKEKYEGNLAYNQEVILGNHLDSILFHKLNILDTSKYSNASIIYNFLDSLTGKITSSSEIILIANKKYICRIIIDTGINIFNLPGNFIYLTTGLLKKIDNTAQLAAGLAHFISHNDRRHQTNNLEKIYDINSLLNAISGDEFLLNDISNKIVSNDLSLKYSENEEKEAINFTINCLYNINYDILEIINFENLLLKSEPLKNFHSIENKEKFINDRYIELGMPEGNEDKIQYDIFKNLLP